MNKSLIHPFPKASRLRKRKEYQRMMHGSQHFVGHWILVDIRQGYDSSSKLGVTVTRKYGKAFARNRFKRIVREAFRLSYLDLPQRLNILVRPRSRAATAGMHEIQMELKTLVSQFRFPTKS